ncbi:EamA family transporter [Nocardia sp. NPDC051052]|uniref:EamA family transporter n=1 Tax=Nocardia sp. NPDC051052 TaxID=3364322 RepID=UPI0037A5E917
MPTDRIAAPEMVDLDRRSSVTAPRQRKRAARLLRYVPPSLLVVVSILGIQFGQAWVKGLFGTVSPWGVVALRLIFAAVVLLVLLRPRLPTDRKIWVVIIGYGSSIAGMNLFIYPALEQLPVGIAVTLQFLGPFSVAVLGSRRPTDVIWALLAGFGVCLFLLPQTSAAGLSAVGIFFALSSGASWACYIVLNKHAGDRTGTAGTLALAVCWAAIVSAPIGFAHDGLALITDTHVLATGFGVAILSAVIPYLFDWAALRRISSQTFGILGSLEPAAGGLAAFILLGEVLTPIQMIAVACVVTASAAASMRGR